MFELKKLYKSLIIPIIVIILCVYSFITLINLHNDYYLLDHKYYAQVRGHFESTMMESFAFSKSS
ncbi:MAG: hypothetical protein E7K75_02375, partial [Finegoldia magna]|nr:hypothetical protein [Finegoldia magna]